MRLSIEQVTLLQKYSASAPNDHEFTDIIYLALSAWGISETAFRDAFGLTAMAVQNWMNGNNLPQEDVRPKIVAWILSEATR